jgi:RNA polymerase sigma-70 factor (ECF subfamily)
MPLLIRFVMRLGADPHAAADAAHSAFTAACAQWEGIDNHGAWLRTVASRAYYRQRLCPETPVEALPERLQFYDDPVELGEQAAAVYSALAALPDRPRQVMAWHLDGYETGEIARRLGLTPAAVRQNLCRARERLRQLLGPLRGEQEGVPAP